MSGTTTRPGRVRGALLFLAMLCAACASHPRLESGDPLIEAGAPEKREVWRRDLGRAVQISPLPLEQDWIIAPTEGSLLRLRGKDGKDVWRRKLRSGAASRPVICGDMLVVSTDVSQAEVLGISLADGTVKWKWGQSFGYLAALDSLVIFAGRGGRVVALDPTNGTVKWERSHPGSGWRPPYADRNLGLVFVPVRPDSVLAFDPGGTVRWARSVGSWPRVVASDQGLFVSTDDSTLVRLDPATGEERARRSFGAMPAGSPVVLEGTVHVTLRNGTLLALDAETLAERWSARFEPPLVSAPLVAEDFIAQAGTRGRIYLLGRDGAPFDTLRHPEQLESTPGFGAERLAVGGSGGTVILFRKQSG